MRPTFGWMFQNFDMFGSPPFLLAYIWTTKILLAIVIWRFDAIWMLLHS
jgi:hypothetical protein